MYIEQAYLLHAILEGKLSPSLLLYLYLTSFLSQQRAKNFLLKKFALQLTLFGFNRTAEVFWRDSTWENRSHEQVSYRQTQLIGHDHQHDAGGD